MKRVKKLISFMLVFAMLVTSLVTINPSTAEAAKTKMKLNKTKVVLVVGENAKLKVNGTKKTVKWASSNKKIATVTKKGKVTAKKVGNTVITANISGKLLKCKVIVKKNLLNKSKATIAIGDKLKLKVRGKAKNVKWTSSNKKVATVNKKGVVKAKKVGTTKITAKIGKKKLVCKVKVKETLEDGYKVSFMNNYDSADNSVYTTQYIKEGGYVTEPEQPVREGYQFIGWYLERDCHTVFAFANDTITADTNIYAYWMEMVDADTADVYNAAQVVAIEYAAGDFADSVIGNIKLPATSAVEGVAISWSSSDESVVKADGTVTRASEDKKVTLTATFTKGAAKADKAFTVIVKKKSDVAISDTTQYSTVSLQRLNDGEYFEIEYADNALAVESITGNYSEFSIETSEDALRAIYGVHAIIGVANPEKDLQCAVVNRSSSGRAYTFEQKLNDIPVYGRSVTLTADSDLQTDSLDSSIWYGDTSKVAKKASVSQDDANAVVTANYAGGEVSVSNSELVVYTLGKYNNNPVLAYSIDVAGIDAAGKAVEETYFVNAEDKSVIKHYSKIDADKQVTGRGFDELANVKSFPVQFKSKDLLFFYMQDAGRNITTYDEKFIVQARVGSEFNVWTDPTAVSAYTNMIDVYDWYKSKLGHVSVDNNNLPLNVIVHYPWVKSNAFWSSENMSIHFCDNSLSDALLLTTSAAAYDVTAHEYTHGVVHFVTNDGLSYPGAPKAINEAYADIFASMMDGNWTMGEHWQLVRDMSNPDAKGNAEGYMMKNYYDYTTGSLDENDDYGQCHSNSTVISHAAYLMSKYGLSESVYRQVWYDSLYMGYDATTDFFDVRKNVLKAAYHNKCTSEQISIIKKAFNEVNLKGHEGDAKVIVKDFETGRRLGNANIKFIQNYVTMNSITTDTTGEAFVGLEVGTYDVEVSLDNFVTFRGQIDIKKDATTTLEIVMVKAGRGKVGGYITNAINAKRVNDVTLTVRKGWNNTSGAFSSQKTIASEDFSFTLEAGYYTIYMEKDGFSPSYMNIVVYDGMDKTDQIGSMSPFMGGDMYRVVLTWDSDPRDLDSHMRAKLSDGATPHVYFSNKKGYNKQHEIVINLDVDETQGYGPETTTFGLDLNSTYKYYVKWYAGTGSWAGSQAKVELYNGNTLIATYTPPVSNTSEEYWNIFSITNGILTVDNRLTTTEPK